MSEAARSGDDWLASLRQMFFPPEIQIGPAGVDPALRDRIEAMVRDLAGGGAAAGAEGAAGLDARWARVFADLATCLWRLRQKLAAPGTDDALPGMEQAWRHFESAWAVLADAGFRVASHDGEPVPEGGVYALRTIATESVAGLARAQVLETIKPSIYLHDRVVQPGEVVVGVPADAPPAADRAAKPSDGAPRP
jgi:hypothetical protein